MGRKPTETNDSTGTEPKRAKRAPKRYTVVQRGPKVFEVLDTHECSDVGGHHDPNHLVGDLFAIAATHRKASLARAVARELNGEE